MIRSIDERIAEPELATLHYKALKFIRGYFPTARLVYFTKQRVLAEIRAASPVLLRAQLTPAGQLVATRGFRADGRVIVNDAAGDQKRAARVAGLEGSFGRAGNRYWNGGGAAAQYDWETLNVRWALFIGPHVPDADEPEDKH
ncbi:MAG: hypothetical protein RLZ42_1571 [Armatimonadota bacterium]